jgi:hypothetical protein
VCWSGRALVLHPRRGSVQVTSELSRLIWCQRLRIVCVHAERVDPARPDTDVAETGATVTIGLVVPCCVPGLAPARARGGPHADTAFAISAARSSEVCT